MGSRWERADRLDQELANTIEELAETRQRLEVALSNPTAQAVDTLRRELAEMERKYLAECRVTAQMEKEVDRLDTEAKQLRAQNTSLVEANARLTAQSQQHSRTVAELNTRIRQLEFKPVTPAQPQSETPASPSSEGRRRLLEID